MDYRLTLKINLTLMLSVSFIAHAGEIKPFHNDPTPRQLGTSATACDIIKFQCGLQAGINRAYAQVQDFEPVAKPIVQVQIAPWNTVSSSCGTYTAAQKDNDPFSNTGDGAAYSGFSLATAFVPASSGGFYCVKVCKAPGRQNGAALPATAVGAENYRLRHDCQNSASPTGHPQSIFPGTYLQNQ